MEMQRCKKRSRRTLRSFCSLLSAGGGVEDRAGDGLDLLLLLLLGV